MKPWSDLRVGPVFNWQHSLVIWIPAHESVSTFSVELRFQQWAVPFLGWLAHDSHVAQLDLLASPGSLEESLAVLSDVVDHPLIKSLQAG